MDSLHKIDKNTIIQIEKENYYYLNVFFQNYLNINNIEQEKYQKLYNTLVIDSIYQFYIIFNLIENDIKNINFKGNDLDNTLNLVDIGTGFGFPGIIISILYKNYKLKNLITYNLKIHLIESNQKKTNFLNNIKKELNLGIEIINMDCKEYIKKEPKKFELVISKAVFKMPNIIDIYKKYSNLLSFWLYSKNYKELLKKYENKIIQYFEIYKIYEYEINDNNYYTIVLLRKHNDLR
jgi:16S rRNA G527 N7-methylase RsmG